ncbi:MAG: TIGR00730 family Rossman fold protein [Nitrospinaceae bacterium]|nr:TIGR00730 family Rossman fold protein [Nitrospinaceae bacterium]NIR55347.1 TIGR00730 family Rossman fold protein [Nitrospinaceae bacterium]NIS85786.1 TIGR00730 family Rossman fold protein [Nitrospinaceae bacterium]NIT82636.1 TIGR00730 family Rossman fold protein [Nitrospinaceae bacterium]NIU44841.1 TIGR00730 family Rossman fold protein [Nitrospinaceae bacterium]
MRHVQSLCVFCASSNAVDAVYLEAAADLGRRMGEAGIHLVYGGASIGLMGAVARGVHQRGGTVTGVLPQFFQKKEIEYSEADELIVTRDMRERKAVMDERSDAFVVLPGGVGTLEEAMEIFSLVQLKQTSKPLVFINTAGFYDGLIRHFEQLVELKFAKAETLKMYAMVPSPEEAIRFIEDFKPPELHSKWI